MRGTRWIYIVRHGIAVPPGTPDIPDDERPLTSKGEKRARQVARALRRLGAAPERIVSSPLPRAWRTAAILAGSLECDEVVEPSEVLRAGASAEEIRAWLDGRTEPVLMIVGHNPALSELVGLLVGGQGPQPPVELGKAGVALLAYVAGIGWRIKWIANAGFLRRIG